MKCETQSSHWVRSKNEIGGLMLHRLIGAGLAFDTILVCIEGSIPAARPYLPIGGSNLAQLGFTVGFAIAVTHLLNAMRRDH